MRRKLNQVKSLPALFLAGVAVGLALALWIVVKALA
jgi:hypothetical protein